jgi:hypothetical protein
VLKEVYHARSAVVVPGSGSFGMEAVARQFAGGKKTLIVRNGWFSYRWTQILDMGQIASEQLVLKARPVAPGRQAAFAPAPIAEVVAAIQAQRPLWCLRRTSKPPPACSCPTTTCARWPMPCTPWAACWCWTASPAARCGWTCRPRRGRAGQRAAKGLERITLLRLRDAQRPARTAIDATTSTSFAADLKKWLQIMETYESGGHAYHTTLPTDALTVTRDVMLESRAYGFEKLRAEQWEIGRKVRAMLGRHGIKSVAAEGFQAPGVVVSYTDDMGLHTGKAFLAEGLQTAAGVPLQCDEPAGLPHLPRRPVRPGKAAPRGPQRGQSRSRLGQDPGPAARATRRRLTPRTGAKRF